MKKIYILLLILLTSKLTFSQGNLIHNPSFEQIDSCPYTLGQVDFALGWSSYKQSPDYYNSCSGGNSIVSVPSNVAGFQNAHSGTAYVGLQTFFTPGTREIVGSQLLSPMIIGQEYFVSLYIACAFDTTIGLQIACASNKIGVKFSTQSYSITNPVTISNFAHIYADSILTDTIDWFHLTGSFIADSAYNNVMIGNFFDDLNTDTIQFYPNYFRSYYLIDDICVSESPECVLTSYVDESAISSLIYFDQFSQKVVVDDDEKQGRLFVYDYFGRLIYDQKYFENSTNMEFDLPSLAKGLYIAICENHKHILKLKFRIN